MQAGAEYVFSEPKNVYSSIQERTQSIYLKFDSTEFYSEKKIFILFYNVAIEIYAIK